MKPRERPDSEAMKKELARKKEEREQEGRQARARRNDDRRGRQIAEPHKSAAVYRPNPELAAIIGSRLVSHREAGRKVWAYIRNNRLQDKDDKTSITADDRVAALCGAAAGDDIDADELYAGIGGCLIQDARADAQRRLDREADEKRARQEREKRLQEQRERLRERERARGDAEDKRRQAFEEHQRRVEDEYKRLKGG